MDNLAIAFIKELNSNKVRYCHWKSNIDLENALAGEGDLDLLVDRRDKSKFDFLILKLGFKRANSRWERQFPGMEDYAGWDEKLDLIVHLHVHYQLVLGATYAKSIHLPIERKYLEDTYMYGEIRIPEKKNELLVFLFRHILKARLYDFLINRKIKKRVIEELDYLQSDVPIGEVKPLLKMVGLKEALFEEMVWCLRKRSPLGVLYVKRKLQWAMCDRQRFSYGFSIWRPIFARIQIRLDSLLGKNGQGKMPSSGGFVISVVGSDGAGKSSLVSALKSWLGQFFSVSLFHMGKPPQSMSSFVLLRLASRVLAMDFEWMRAGGFCRDFTMSIQQLLLAKDRYASMRKIRRLVGQGRIVITDRYPLPELTTMESMSSIVHLQQSNHSLIRSLARRAATYYESYDEPGLMLVLKVSEGAAATRRPNDDIESLKKRIDEVNLIPEKSNCYMIETDKDLEEVSLLAKRAVWSWI